MQRRSFLSRFPALAALVGAGAATPAAASGLAPENGRFEPVKHPQDDWLDSLPGKHRVVFDTWTASKFPEAMQFANNIYRGNRDYDLLEKDTAIVIVARHRTAPFAFNDAMWAKYGQYFSERMDFVDPKTNKAPNANVHYEHLQDFHPQGGQRQLGTELGGHIANVERRVHFHQVERRQQSRVGDDFHHHVRLAIVEAALDRRADTGRNLRIADVHVERHVNAGGAVARQVHSLLDHRRDALAIDVFHGEDVNL
jgi:hypothetical protein